MLNLERNQHLKLHKDQVWNKGGRVMKLTVEKVNKVIDMFFEDLKEDVTKIVPKTENK